MIINRSIAKVLAALTVSLSLSSCGDMLAAYMLPTLPYKSKVKKMPAYVKGIGKDRYGMPTYADGARIRIVRATAFSHKEEEVGAPGRKTASMSVLKYSLVRSVAADWSRLPLGTKLRVLGMPGLTFVVDDYGRSLAGSNTIDIFHPTLSGMRAWGTRNIIIEIIEMGDWEASAKLLRRRTRFAHCRKMYYAIKGKKNKKNLANN